MKKILISAFIGSNNLGDEAIFKSIIDNLGVDKSSITAVSVNECKTKLLGVNTVSAKNIIKIVQEIKNCDVFLVGGGGIIQDQSSILNFLYFFLHMFIAIIYKKRIALCFVGIGPIKYKISQFLFRTIANYIELAIVRDELSKNILLKYVSSPDKVFVAYDPVLNFVFDLVSLNSATYYQYKPYFVVSMRNWFFTNPLLPARWTRNISKIPFLRCKFESLISKIAEDIDTFLRKHPDINAVFASLYDEEDLPVLHRIREKLKNKKQIIIAPDNLSEIEYLSIVNQANFTLGMRLHSLILSTIVNKPFVALVYSPKVEEFAKQFNQLSVEIEDYEHLQLLDQLESIYLKIEDSEQEIKTRLKKHQQQNKEMFIKIRQLIDDFEKPD